MAKAKVNKGPIELGNLLSELITQKTWQARFQLHQVFTFWDDVVGPDIALRAQPQVIKGTVLWVGVSDSIWMQQLQYERQYILETINTRLGPGDSDGGGDSGREQGRLRLTELRLTLDTALARNQLKVPSALPPQPVVDQAQLAEFTSMLSSIPDPELRQAMIRVWLAMHRGGQQR